MSQSYAITNVIDTVLHAGESTLPRQARYVVLMYDVV